MRNDRTITVEKTNYIKAFALILMMWHHLFGCGSFLTLKENSWFSLFPTLIVTLSASAKICISMFLFCTGYGIYYSYVRKVTVKKTYILTRILKVLIPYWVIMAFTIIYLIATGKFEHRYIFVNLFALLHNDDILYVSFCWFIKLYLCILLLFPVIRLIEKRFRKNIIIDIGLYVVIPFALAFFLRGFSNEVTFGSFKGFMLSTIQFTFSWVPLISVGILFAKYNIYEKIRGITDKMPHLIVVILSIACMITVLFVRSRFNYGQYSDAVYSPLFIIGFLLLVDNLKWKSKYVIPYIGKNSLHYWLLSGIFFLNTSELQFIAYLPKYTIAIFVWTMLLLTPLVMVCSFISNKILFGIISHKSEKRKSEI